MTPAEILQLALAVVATGAVMFGLAEMAVEWRDRRRHRWRKGGE